MGYVNHKVVFTSPNTYQPFALNNVAGYRSVASATRELFIVEQQNDSSLYALVEGNIAAGNLSIARVLESSAANDMPTFTGAVDVKSALPANNTLNFNKGGRKGIVLLGQSNMVGHNGTSVDAGSAGYNAVLDAPDSNILQLRKSSRYTVDHATFLNDTQLVDTYSIATEPLDHAEDSGSNVGTTHETSVGCGLTFAKECRKRIAGRRDNSQLVLLPCSKGSTGIISGTSQWAPPTGTMFVYSYGVINEFLAENPDNEIIAILYQQGETDALTSTVDPGEWTTGVQGLIDALRGNTYIVGNTRQADLSRVPFVIGGIKQTGTSNAINIEADGKQLVLDNELVGHSTVDDAWTYFEFGLHTDAIGQRARGRLLYTAYVEALYNVSFDARPSAVQNMTAAQIENQVTIGWDLLTGQSPAVTGYEVQYKLTSAGDETYTAAVTKTSTDTSHAFTGLTNEIDYTFRINAVNGTDTGDYSTITETPETDLVPTAPQNFTPTDQPTVIQLDWDALVFDPVVTSYTLQIRETGVGTFGVEIADINVGNVITYNYTVPADNTEYDFRLVASNSVGVGAASNIVTQAHSSSPTLALNPYLWLRKGIGQTVNGDSVDWVDQSGNGNDAFPVTGREVDIVAGGIFTLADGRLEVPEAARLHEDGYTVVMRVKSEKTGTRAIFGSDGMNYVGEALTDRLRAHGNSDLYMTTDPFFVNGEEKIFAVTHDGATAKFYNGSTWVNDVSGTLKPYVSDNNYLGAWNDFSSSDWDAHIYDIAVFRTVLSQPDIAAVIGEFPA